MRNRLTTRCIGKVFLRRNNTFTDNIFTNNTLWLARWARAITSVNQMADTIIQWQDQPQQEGWYATLLSWEVEEGISSGANYWNGSCWDSNEPIFKCAGPFKLKDVAELWAYKTRELLMQWMNPRSGYALMWESESNYDTRRT